MVTGYFGWLDRAVTYAADDESAAVAGLEITPFIDREQGAEDENVAGNNHLYLPVITR